jgi:hypothetical protein
LFLTILAFVCLARIKQECIFEFVYDIVDFHFAYSGKTAVKIMITGTFRLAWDLEHCFRSGIPNNL